MIRSLAFSLTAAALLAGCAVVPDRPPPQDEFFSRLRALCGTSYEGRVVTADAADRDFASSRLVMHVRTCSDHEIRIPFHVGEDRSRTWVITRTPQGLRLKHDHRHRDGSEDVLTQYGGDTARSGTPRRQEFPADRFSQDLFVREGIPQSAANVWAMEVEPRRMFAYELTRPNRNFRVEFDLTRPVPSPPAPWGHN
jgi:hypothetical protein